MMKKMSIFILIILAMLVFTACDNLEFSPMLYDNSFEGQKISFSLDAGKNWKTEDDLLKEFDIWDINYNKEVPGMVFFYATTYKELEEKVKANKTTSFYSYKYVENEGWDNILNTFGEEYFKDNILLFYYKYEPNISKNYVHSVSVLDDRLVLNVNRFEGQMTALSAWLHIVTINKTDVENVKKFDVVVRTVSSLQKSITIYPKKDYMRDIYVNGLSKADFKGLDNLKSVSVWTWNIMVDIQFNETISEERLNSIVETLSDSENIESVGYTSNKWIRVRISNRFYDNYLQGTLKLSDILEDDLENYGGYTMKILNFTPIATITLEMEKHGREYAEEMIRQLKELNFKFINYEEIN